MNDFESLTVISVEYGCKVNPDRFKCLKMINSLEHLEKKNRKFNLEKVIKCNQLHYFNKVIEIATLLTF